MIALCSFLILILSFQSRNYESIYTIRNNLFPKFHDMSLKLEISGKNDYTYKFESQNILYAFKVHFINDTEKIIILKDQKIELVFKLSIYESGDRIFDYFPKDIVYSELVKVGINFQILSFYKAKQDFSFDIKYKIDNIDNDMVIYFDNIKDAFPFKYLIFEDKDESYENKTLYNLMKSKILENLIENMRKGLIIYPEYDTLYHFNSLRQYFTNNQFEVDYTISVYSYYRANINYFNYEEITKIGDILQLKKINTKITLIYYDEYGYGYDDYDDRFETHVLFFEYLNINPNLVKEYGKLTRGDKYAFDILRQIIDSIKL